MHIKKIIHSIFILVVLAACTGPKTTTTTTTTAPAAAKKKTVTKKLVDGYQLQVLNTTDRSEAINAKSLLLTKFPNQKTFLLFQNPYYKIRFGNFLTETEAVGYQKKIESYFTNVFVIPVKIEIKLKE
jgi:SPOR domain